MPTKFEGELVTMTPASTGSAAEGTADPGVARAGAATAARRRELDISQRQLASDGIINAGALIAFEKGRSWPRERTRTKLENVLRWPAGTIARIRGGEDTPGQQPPQLQVVEPSPVDGHDVMLIAQVVSSAVENCRHAADALPSVTHRGFTAQLAPILAELRQLEAVAARSAEVYGVTPALIGALGTVRRHYDNLMMIGAAAPSATLGQRLYACRRRANLSITETAQAAGVTEDLVEQAEAEKSLPTVIVDALDALIRTIKLA